MNQQKINGLSKEDFFWDHITATYEAGFKAIAEVVNHGDSPRWHVGGTGRGAYGTSYSVSLCILTDKLTVSTRHEKLIEASNIGELMLKVVKFIRDNPVTPDMCIERYEEDEYGDPSGYEGLGY